MPKMLITEEEKADILRQREIRAMQAVAWNEAIDACFNWINNYVPEKERDKLRDEILGLKRNPAKP